MFIILSVAILVVGLLLTVLSFKIHGAASVAMRSVGVILCIASAVLIYALMSGKIVLPLNT